MHRRRGMATAAIILGVAGITGAGVVLALM